MLIFMKYLKVIIILLFIVQLCFSAHIYNPNQETELNIIVTSIYKKNLYNYDDFTLINAKNLQNNLLFTFELAPYWFLKEKEFDKIKIGDRILVRGANVKDKINWIMVREIIKPEDLVIKVRTEAGFPLWRTPNKNI